MRLATHVSLRRPLLLPLQSEAPPPVEQQVTDHARRAQTDLSAAYRSGAGVAAQLDPALAAPPPCAPDNRAQTIHSLPQRRGSGVYGE